MKSTSIEIIGHQALKFRAPSVQIAAGFSAQDCTTDHVVEVVFEIDQYRHYWSPSAQISSAKRSNCCWIQCPRLHHRLRSGSSCLKSTSIDIIGHQALKFRAPSVQIAAGFSAQDCTTDYVVEVVFEIDQYRHYWSPSAQISSAKRSNCCWIQCPRLHHRSRSGSSV